MRYLDFIFALRNLRNQPLYSGINFLGFAFGLAAAIAVLLFVHDEINYEHCHARADQIVRVNTLMNWDGKDHLLGSAPNILAPVLAENLPQVEQAARVLPNNFTGEANVRAGTQNFAEKKMFWADPNIAKILTFKFLEKESEDMLARPGTAVLSASIAKKYFGKGAALGKSIKIDNVTDLEITGVFEDFPDNTHQKFDVVGSFQSIRFGKVENQNWGNASFLTFLLLRPGTNVADVETRTAEIVQAKRPANAMQATFKMVPLREVHLHSGNVEFAQGEAYGDIRQVRIFSGLALMLLLIACINYTNLATAQSQKRAKEVALRKTLGSSAGALRSKFYIETGLMSGLGIIGSLAILALTLPYFNQLADKNLSLGFFQKSWFWTGILAVWATVTLVAGAYPAMILSSFSPMQTLRQQFFGANFGSTRLRQGLVVFQFCVSIALIFGTLVFNRQLAFIRNKNLGYNAEQVVAVKVTSAENREQLDRFQNELLQVASVGSTARAQTFPGRGGSGRNIAQREEDDGAPLTTCRARPDVFKVLNIAMLAGAPMKVPVEGDTITEVVLNRSAAKYLGWSPEEAVGKKISASLQNAEVVGVVEDFHFGTLKEKIGHYAFHNADTEGLDFQLISIKTGNIPGAMADIEAAFRRALPNSAFDYIFLDEHLGTLYRKETRMARVAFVFAGLAIFVACLGLFALAAFTVERRQKEIGIRKVLGASIANITGLLTKDFLKLVLIAMVIATPIAYYVMNQWLADFAYRIKIQWWMFTVAELLAIAIAFLTVGVQSVKAALANPVKSLRSE